MRKTSSDQNIDRARRLMIAVTLCVWLFTGLCQAQVQEQGIWPRTGQSSWFWVAPRTDLSPTEVDAVLKRIIDEQTAYVDAKFSATIFLARKARLTKGKSRKRKGYGDQPGKADDLRIEAEWQNGYLNQNRGQSYTFIPLDAIRSLDLNFLQRMRERFPKAPEGRNWNVNILANSMYSFFFSLEDSARAFINAVASVVKQRGLKLDFSRFGLMWENVTPAQAADMGLAAGGEVLVTMVAVGGPGDHAGIRALDAVLEVNGVKVKNFSHFFLLLDAIPAGGKTSLLVLRRLRSPDQDPEPTPWETLTVKMETR